MIVNKVCTHCKQEIECKVDQIADCDCSKVEVSNDTRLFLKQTYHKCLCNTCLENINDLVAQAKGKDFPKRRSEMIEGVHYYIENGYFVFTELYHLMKGYCCQNGCRHCVYGFKNRYL
ncbi:MULTISPECIES: cysteine-rich CWC family protein [Myroides]|uniref:Cysteine-rich CWC n=1 Tax=Myroides albus TaxID=2562892 RepID=A0A6I3LKC2_9FLAO|nr:MULTISPECIES: cysteine-rich CWC family protein [Myroides]MTG96951.1 hypothetical protein [Myroides albus]MVX35356.1 hypothetical protein [Myroides sp. LoEW2-1]UVD78297.1 cysteine-rich CWC family protein [Myroides albus]